MKAVKTPGATVSSASIRSVTPARPESTIARADRLSRSDLRGFTLVEAAVSSALLAIILLGILAGLFYAYNTAASVRYHDSARFILKSFADQFLVMPSQTTLGSFNPLWSPTTAPTGIGLAWEDFNGTTTTHVDGTSAGLAVHLGGNSGNPLDAVVTRDVRYLDASGAVVSSISRSSVGYLLRGDFTVSYTFKGQNQSQTITLVRAWP